MADTRGDRKGKEPNIPHDRRISESCTKISVILVSAFCIFSFIMYAGEAAGADDGDTFLDGDFQYLVTGGDAQVIGYHGSGTSVVIPDTANDGSTDICVTSIGEDAFGNLSIVDVELSDTITSVADYAFAGCAHLMSVHLNNVTSVGQGAFSYCRSLTNISVGSGSTLSVAENGTILLGDEGKTLISYPSASGDVVIPDSVKVIAKCAFQGSAVVCVDMNCCERIEDHAFADCSQLEQIELNDVSEVGTGIFALSVNLTNITVNENNDKLSVFDDKILFNKDMTELIAYPSVSGHYQFPENVRYVGAGAFESSCIESVDMRNATLIGVSAFENCAQLNAVSGERIKEIEDRAFLNCTLLRSASFIQLQTIKEYSFFGTVSLQTVSTPSADKIGASAFEDSGLKYITIRKGAEYDTDSFPSGVKKIFVENSIYATVDTAGTNITVTVTPAAGFSVDTFNVYYLQGGNKTDVGGYNGIMCTFDPSPSDEYFVYAGTSEIMHTVSVSVSGKGLLRYSINGGEPAELTGELSVREGSTIEITADPLYGYDFVRWSDGSTGRTLNISIYSNTELSAEFKLKDGMEIVTIPAPEGKGTYMYRVNGTGEFTDVPEDHEIIVPKECTLEIMAVPSDGYRFAGWSNGHMHPVLRIDDMTSVSASAKFIEDTDGIAKNADMFIYLLIMTMLTAVAVSLYKISKRGE